MKSFTTLRNLYGTLTLDQSATNLTLGDQLINDETRHILSMADWPFTHRTRTVNTVASQQAYALPYDVGQVESVYVTVSSQRHTPKLLHSREQWDILNRTAYTSDIPQYAFVYNGELNLWPTPTSSSNVITVNGKINPPDLNTADITSSTITSLANGGTALVVNAGLTVKMIGFWIRPTFSTTANTGDGRWYEFTAISTTAGTLVRPYGGVSIAGGTAACTIGQMPLLPEAFHDLPVIKATETYWSMTGNFQKAEAFGKRYDEGLAQLLSQYKSPITDLVIDNGRDAYLVNPNLTITL